MTTDPRRVCVLTGVPGSGKTSVASRIVRGLDSRLFVLVHADDSIGPTFECFRELAAKYGDETWAHIRGLHPFFVGWSAGWYLWKSPTVLIEGHLKDRVEIDRLFSAIADQYPNPFSRRVVWLDDDVETIVAKLTDDPYREPQWNGPDRPIRFRYWITKWEIDPSIADAVVDRRGKTNEAIDLEVKREFRIPQSPLLVADLGPWASR